MIMRLGLFSLNLGGISVIDPKFNVLVSLLSECNPDIALFQEIRIRKGMPDLLGTLQQRIGLPHRRYDQSHDFAKDYGKGKTQDEQVIEGLGVLSKIEFTASSKKLPIIKGVDRWPRIAVKYRFDRFTVCNLHLSKYPKTRKLQVNRLPEADMYVGDFNMSPTEVRRAFPSMVNSYDVDQYTSFPSENATYDYVILRRGKFISVSCKQDSISDHRAIMAVVDL